MMTRSRALHRALDLGCNFIDTALGYGNGRSEQLIGSVLKERRAANAASASTSPRRCRRRRHLAAQPV